MSEELVFSAYQVCKAFPPAERGSISAKSVAEEAQGILDEYADKVEVRGFYSTTGFTAEADLVTWLIAKSADDIQDVLAALRKSTFGTVLRAVDTFLGLVRPAEFAKDHLPAFVKGAEPKKYFTVYPFVRTPDWYLLEPDVRGKLLREHGEAGREFPDVLANTVSAFGLGDYEWILAFEADSPDRLVDLLRRLRATDARRYTKVETPFYTGIRKDLLAVLNDLL
jgi:hydrogen peroxide-dependent heme synthase